MKRGSGAQIVMLLTNQATFDQRPLKEAHSLAKAGFKVTILAWDRDLETRTDTIFDDGLEIKRLRLKASFGRPFQTIAKHFVFYLWCFFHLIGMKTDAIHSHDVDTLPVGFAAKTFLPNRPKLVYDMHDLPEMFLRYIPLVRYTQAAFLASARVLADAVIIVNDRFIGYLGAIGFDRKRLVVVMNAEPSAGARRAHLRGSPLNILYYGWMMEERGVRLLVEAVEGLDNVALTLAGKGPLEGWVRGASAKDPSVRYLGWLKMDDLEHVTREADVIASLALPHIKNSEMATPNKLMTAMSLSLPTIVPSGTYQAEIVTKYRCGVVVDWKDVADVRRAMQRLALDAKYYDALAGASYQAFLSAYSWEIMEKRLLQTYDYLLGHKGEPPPQDE